MDACEDDPLPDWGPMVLAHAREPMRSALSPLLRLDGKLSRVIAGASEPALAQIRLAWWREELLRPRTAEMRQPADPLLADLLEHWDGNLQALVSFIDGWEELLDQQPWDEGIRTRFEEGHSAAFEALARLGGQPAHAVETSAHARVWARAKLAALEPGLECEAIPRLPSLPSELRAPAIIGGLSRRAILRGGKPLFGDRLSPLVALRLGIFGT